MEYKTHNFSIIVLKSNLSIYETTIYTDNKSIADLYNDTGETVHIEPGKICYVNSYDENHKCKRVGIRIEDIKAIYVDKGGKQIKDILLGYLQKNCIGADNRKSGRQIQNDLGINYKIISHLVQELQTEGIRVFNQNGYFIAQYNDDEVLKQKYINNLNQYIRLNREMEFIEETMKDKSKLEDLKL